MQKTFLSLLLISTLVILTSCEKETLLPANNLPNEIKSFISSHFSDLKIVQAIEERENFNKTWDVLLEDFTRLEFNRRQAIIDIESNYRLPDSVIQANILNWLNENFPDNYILAWEIEGKNQEIKLDNGVEIHFSKSGNFIRIDI